MRRISRNRKDVSKIDMNKLSCMLLASILCSATTFAQDEPLHRMAIMSDVHLMAHQLLAHQGKAFDEYIANDRKMLEQSPELLDTVASHVEAFRPQVVLVTGDLTKDGERVSHELLVDRYLKPMEAQGIRVFVIPGNHDVNNPHAKVYDGDGTRRTASVSATDFADIYKEYGYGEAIARDDRSLSYVVQLDARTRLIAVDACEYENNDFDKDICVTAGRIKPETMDFIKRQTEEAHSRNMDVLMMMHHGIVSHFCWQDKVMGEYLVDHWRKQARQIAKLGIKVCFTGHFHSQDVSRKYGLTDMETGSTVSYPHPYRLIEVDGNEGTLTVRTERVNELASMKESPETLQQKSERFANSALSSVMEHLVPKKVPASVKQECGKVLGEAYALHLAGDEQPSADFKSRLKTACRHLRHYSWKWAFIMKKIGKYLSTDTGVADNNLQVYYKDRK